MDSHFEALREARASLPEEVRQTADALLKLLEGTGGVPTHVRAALRVACEGVDRRLAETRLTIALVGDAGAGRRTLINALLGDRVLPTSTPRRGSTITVVRRAPTLEFSASSLDGRSVARLSRKMPDRTALFENSMAQIDRETAALEVLAARLQAARQRAAALEIALHDRDDVEQRREGTAALDRAPEKPAPLRSLRRAALLWHALWSWILPLFLRWSWLKKLLPAGTSEGDARQRPPREQGARHAARLALELEEARAEIAASERELAGMRSVEQIAVHAERLRLERRKYEEERGATFLSQVRAFDGTDISERIVEYPARYLPDGVTLMDLPCPSVTGAPVVEHIRRRVAREVDALVVVEDVAQPPGDATASLVRELSDFLPVVLVVLTKADGPLQLVASGAHDDVPSRIEQVRREAFDRVAAPWARTSGGRLASSLRPRPRWMGDRESSALADHFHATIGALSERLERMRPVVMAWREALRIRVGVAELSRTQAGEEDSSQEAPLHAREPSHPRPGGVSGAAAERPGRCH